MREAPTNRCLVQIATVAWLICGAGPLFAYAPGTVLESPIVFVQLPVDAAWGELPSVSGGMLRAEYGKGGRIVRLDPGGQFRVLTEGFTSACELDVSFDAQRILFAAKREPPDRWDIWEMAADGSGVRRITNNIGNCRSPAYQATLYTIISAEPWYQVMFISDASSSMNEYGSGLERGLYSCRLDGSSLRRLTMNLSDDMDPFLMDDGRVLLAGWQRMDLRRGFRGRVSLFGVNTDGADYALFCGDEGKRIKHMPCVTTGRLVVFVEADRVGWDGAGQLGSVTLRRNFHSYRPVTDDPARVYHSPSPLRDGSLLVSSRPTDVTGTHGIFRLDPVSGDKQLIFDDPDFHDMHCRVLAPRPQPDGRSSVVNEKYPTGKLYCLNAYLTDPEIMPHVRPGAIRSLRVIEGVPLAGDPRSAGPLLSGAGNIDGSTSRANGAAPVVQKRLLGIVPVEEDGSFHIELPADVPVQLQTLDANGMALRTCGWIWVKHREPRGCIGCHEDPELTPENRFVQAVQRPGIKLTLPASKRRTVDFRRDVMPIIARKCTPCHARQSTGLDLNDKDGGTFNRAYTTLLTGVDEDDDVEGPVVGKYVHPGQARTSQVIWQIFGENTAQPWDEVYQPGQLAGQCPPPEAEQLTPEEKQVLIEWIDLGAHWDGIPGKNKAAAGSPVHAHDQEEK
ncbi:MAG: hypothetical protein JSU63_11010 [Phycisphaerales bacterium]|nr:MAG: hypothetical protein JSU63_11010 [Phycisphaerales bacterium]